MSELSNEGVQSPNWSHLCFSTASSSSSSSSSDFLSCAPKLKEQLSEGAHGKMSSRRTDGWRLTTSDLQLHAHDLCKSTVEANVHKSCSWSKRNSASPARNWNTTQEKNQHRSVESVVTKVFDLRSSNHKKCTLVFNWDLFSAEHKTRPSTVRSMDNPGNNRAGYCFCMETSLCHQGIFSTLSHIHRKRAKYTVFQLVTVSCCPRWETEESYKKSFLAFTLITGQINSCFNWF